MKSPSSRIFVSLVVLAAITGCSKESKAPVEPKQTAETKAPPPPVAKAPEPKAAPAPAIPTPPAPPALPAALLAAVKTIPDEKDQLSVQSTLVDLFESPQTHAFFANNFGCVIFPTIGKGGLGIGGAHGSAWVFKQNKLSGTAKMTQITIGLQAGGQAFSQIIFLEDERAYNSFTSENFELGAQASAVALTAGAQASASTAGGAGAGAGDSQTKTKYSDGMAIFTKAKGGLMYEASVGGQKFKFSPLK